MGQFWALHLVSSLGIGLPEHGRPAPLGLGPDGLRQGRPPRGRRAGRPAAAPQRDRRAVELTLTPEGPPGRGSRSGVGSAEIMAEAARDLAAEDVATAVRVFRELQAPPGHRPASAREGAA